MYQTTSKYTLPALVITLLLLSGCAAQKQHMKSSVVDYLYPNTKEASIKPSIPKLTLPIKVGIAFVPGESKTRSGFNWWRGRTNTGSLTEPEKMNLLDKVSAHFKKYEFVKSIEVIPSAYLTSGGSFTNLKQIQTMYDIDVIALVSYDQVQFTDEGMLSLTYWTLVGAYVVSGEKNDTSTLMDTAVYDIKSRKMLFRAPGTSQVKGAATPINLSEELRNDSIKGFQQATGSMIENLDLQLNRFREKVKEQPEEYKVVHSPSYRGGGGAIYGLFSIILIYLLCQLVFQYGNIIYKTNR